MKRLLEVLKALGQAIPILAAATLLLVALLLAAVVDPTADRIPLSYPLLVLATLSGTLLLAASVAVRAIRLVGEARRALPGARLAARLALLFALLTLPSLAVLYAFSLRFILNSIDAWYDVGTESALNDALELTRLELGRQREAAQQRLVQIDATLSASEDSLDALRRQYALTEVALLGANLEVRRFAAADPLKFAPTLPGDALRLAAEQGPASELDATQTRALMRRVVDGDSGWLWISYPTAAQVVARAANVEEQYQRYRRLVFLRNNLKLSFVVVLSLVVVLVGLLAVLAGFGLARRMVAPIARLVVGTQAVAQGHLQTTIATSGAGELGGLMQSFNQMIEQLRATQSRELELRASLADEREFLATVLDRLPNAVLSFDERAQLTRFNQAASSLLAVDLRLGLGQGIWALNEQDAALAPLCDALAQYAERRTRGHRAEVRLTRADLVQNLLIEANPLGSATANPGFVVAIEDQSMVERNVRESAWGEVARRLAHEIKNPLTPIQLAAERLRFKLSPKLSGAEHELLDRSASTVVAQVEHLRRMVDAFADYARAARPSFSDVDLRALVEESVRLYGPAAAHVDLRISGPPQLRLYADAGRLRQVLANLIKNAQEAIGAHPGQVEIELRSEAARVVLAVSDSGPGWPEALGDRLFEPYATTKTRGTGLGLAIVRRIVGEHAGVVTADHGPLGGARVTIVLPTRAD